MTAQTQKTLLSLGIFGVLVFLAWKIWPTVKHAISGGRSSGSGGTSGGVSAGNPYYGYPQQQPQRSSGSGASLKFPDSGSPSFANNSGFGQFLYNLTRSLTLNTPGPLSDPLFGSVAGYDSTALDNYQIPYQSIDLLDVPSDTYDYNDNISTYDPSLDNFQFDASSFDPGSVGGGFYGGIVDPGSNDPGGGDSFDNFSD
jgi:hypothetical protein